MLAHCKVSPNTFPSPMNVDTKVILSPNLKKDMCPNRYTSPTAHIPSRSDAAFRHMKAYIAKNYHLGCLNLAALCCKVAILQIICHIESALDVVLSSTSVSHG